MFREYTKTMQMLHRFPHAYNAVQTREMNARLVEIANKTRPSNITVHQLMVGRYGSDPPRLAY